MTTDLHDAITKTAESARQLGAIAQSARRRVVELEIELEDTRQELGRVRAGAAAEHEVDPVAYLLWSGKHEAWWKPDARGYTTDLDSAGRYVRAEAIGHVVASAQCGVREQVTTMVAAPENWTGLSPVPVVLAVDPGVQVEQEPRCPCGQEHEDTEVRGLGMVCGRCGQHTGNNTQGHYWKTCSVKAAESKAKGLTGIDSVMAAEHHFCCPPPSGCELAAEAAR